MMCRLCYVVQILTVTEIYLSIGTFALIQQILLSPEQIVIYVINAVPLSFLLQLLPSLNFCFCTVLLLLVIL